MEINVDIQPDCTATLKASIPAETTAARRASIVDSYAAKAKLPGFRPGKAPRKMIEKLYGAGVFYSDAVDIALPEAYTQAIGQSGLDVVGYPEIEIVDDKIDENGFTFKATVAVYPEVKLGEYNLWMTKATTPLPAR